MIAIPYFLYFGDIIRTVPNAMKIQAEPRCVIADITTSSVDDEIFCIAPSIAVSVSVNHPNTITFASTAVNVLPDDNADATIYVNLKQSRKKITQALRLILIYEVANPVSA